MSIVGFTGAEFGGLTPEQQTTPRSGFFDCGAGRARSELWMELDNEPTRIPRLIEALCVHMEQFTRCTTRCRIAVATALEEALTNAVYHGNLEVSSALRDDGDADAYYALARQRRRTPPYCHRRVSLVARFSRRNAEFVIRDQGPGFDHRKLRDPSRPENLGAVSGRGVYMMRRLMDEVRFNKQGNEVRLRRRIVPG